MGLDGGNLNHVRLMLAAAMLLPAIALADTITVATSFLRRWSRPVSADEIRLSVA